MKMKFNFNKILKWTVFIGLLLVILFIIIMKLFPDKSEFKQIPIPETQVQEHKKWQEQGQTMVDQTYYFYGLNGLGYYQKELEKEKNKPTAEELARQDPEAAKLTPLEIDERVKDPDKIDLYQHRLQTNKEPTDLLSFLKQPFYKWINQYLDTKPFHILTDSLLEVYLKYLDLSKPDVKGNSGCLSLCYEGPQYLLEEDKDYYIGEAFLSFDSKEPLLLRKTYYLHFNPVRKTLSVYTNKFNTK